MKRIYVNKVDLLQMFEIVKPQTTKKKLLDSIWLEFYVNEDRLHYSLNPEIKIPILYRVNSKYSFTFKFHVFYKILKSMKDESKLKLEIYKNHILVNNSIKINNSANKLLNKS